MKVLVTGNNGYIGSVLTQELKKNYEVLGYDTDYYYDCNLIQQDKNQIKHTRKDIRDININDLNGIDIVIHLAGLANDPLGNFDPKLTEEINNQATVKLAEFCKRKKVKRFIYASSQSMYGISDSDHELDEDNSKKIQLQHMLKQNGKQKKRLKL